MDSQRGTYVVPVDVLSLVPKVLDPLFFNIDYLVDNGLTDEKMGTVAAIVDYSTPEAVRAQWSPSLFPSTDLRLIHSAAVGIPKDHAAGFAQFLWNQRGSVSLPGINKIWLDKVEKLDLDMSIPLIGGDIARTTLGFNGAGVNIAILDTGIDPTHPDFRFADGSSKITVRLDMTCSVEPIIDVFCDKTTDDLFGHGTHVASIAAGTGAATSGKFTGVAPGATLFNIKVLNQFGFGFDSWIIKGLEVATLGTDLIRGNEPTKEADIISMSFGGGPTDGTDPLSLEVNTLVTAYGVTMVAAAANSYSYFSVANPGAATQAITVAASTKVGSPIISEATPTARSFVGNMLDFSVSIPPAGISTQVVSVANFGGDPTDFPATTAGKIALIARGGGILFRTKAINAATAGAVAALIYNNAPGNFLGTLVSPGVPIPVVSMSRENGLALKADVVAGPTTVNLLTGPPAIAPFSSKGPRVDNFDVKPDITAPGVSVTAACSSTASSIPCPGGSKYTTLSGTSMATPHISGSAALLIQQARMLGKIITPAQIKDMLQGSSQVLGPPIPGQPDVDIYAQGAGLVKIDKALTSDVGISPAEVSFGLQPYDAGILSNSIVVTNRGTTPRTFSLSVELRDVNTPLSPLSTGSLISGVASLGASSITLGAGASAPVTLTVDVSKAPAQKLWSVFGGRVFVKDGSTVVSHAIFGFTREGKRQVLNLDGVLPDGTAASFVPYSFFDSLDAQGLTAFFASLDIGGHSTLRMPLSSYTVMMNVFLFIPITPTQFRLESYRILAMDVPVDVSPAAVTLDASTAGQIRLDLRADRLATAGLQQDAFFMYIRKDGSSWSVGNFLLGGNWDVFGVNPARATLGQLFTHDRWLRARDPPETSPTLYDLTITQTEQRPVVKVVTKASLLETTGVARAEIHADVPNPPTSLCQMPNAPATACFGRFHFPLAFPTFAFSGFYPVKGGAARLEYQSATTDIFRQFVAPGPSIFWFDTRFMTTYFGFPLMGKVWSPGESLSERWIEQPLQSTLSSVSRTGNLVSIAGYEIVDSFGHPGVFVGFSGASFTILVFVDGVLKVASGAFPFPAAQVSVPAAPSKVDVVMSMSPDRSWATLASSTNTRVSFMTSAATTGALAAPMGKYRISNLNLMNQVPAEGRNTDISFTLDLSTTSGAPAIVQTASVMLSTDGGVTWSSAKADITDHGLDVEARIGTSGPGPFYVSVKVTVTLTDGSVLDQTIQRAMQLVRGI
jgi:subtilisin family serine protease